jgi:CheY-like chemotaxis protein
MTHPETEHALSNGTSNRRPGPTGTRLADGRRHGVLVVDDQEGVRGVLELMLRQEGFAVWLAADGWEAIDLYRSRRAAIDLVLLDVRMPGLDGPATLTALRGLNPQVRCCFLSGDLGGYAEGELRDLGAAVLPKPFRPADLALVVGRLTNA